MRCACSASATRMLASRYAWDGAGVGRGTSHVGGAIQTHAHIAQTRPAATELGRKRDREGAGASAFFRASSRISVTSAATLAFGVGRAGVVMAVSPFGGYW